MPAADHQASEPAPVTHMDLIIRSLTPADREPAIGLINSAARWYREFLPSGEVREPEMTIEEWDAETRRMTWYGAFAAGQLVGVMGLECMSDAALLRHGYIDPERQHEGIGSRLRAFLESQAGGVRRIIVGTYAGNYKARGMLEKSGYRLVADSGQVLHTYYAIPEDRVKSSVAYEKLIPPARQSS
jgi:GNAT superfamily N-acetyltransferase